MAMEWVKRNEGGIGKEVEMEEEEEEEEEEEDFRTVQGIQAIQKNGQTHCDNCDPFHKGVGRLSLISSPSKRKSLLGRAASRGISFNQAAGWWRLRGHVGELV